MSSVVVLWLMLGGTFICLIKVVVFFNRYRFLDCCTVLSGKVFLQSLLLCCNGTDMILVTEFFLTTTNCNGFSFFVLFVGFCDSSD